jgi:FkbM family methyltransferase
MIRLPKQRTRITVRPADSDMAVVRQVYAAHEYDLSRFGQFRAVRDEYQGLLQNGLVPLIIDAGAYIGVSSIFFSDMFPGAAVLAIEPNRASARLCAQNTRSHANIRLIESALGGEIGRATLELSPDDGSWSATTSRSTSGEIPIVTIPQLLSLEGERSRLFIVKIDIEGFESDVFEHSTEWLDDAAAIVVEIHDWLFPGKGTSRSLFQAMAKSHRETVISGENLIFFRSSA